MIYYSTEVIVSGGKVQYPCRRVVCDSPAEMGQVFRKLKAISPKEVSLAAPPRGIPGTKSKVLPQMTVRETLMGEVRRLGGVKIPDAYLWVLIYQLKEKYYQLPGGSRSREADEYFVKKIRSKVVELLIGKRRADGVQVPGEWIDNPDQVGDPEVARVINTLNSRFEKIDLGRRSDLKFRSWQEQEAELKYSRSKMDQEYPDEEDPLIRKWLSSSEKQRIELQQDSFFAFKLRQKGYLPNA